MKHLKKFSTEANRITYENSSDYIEPYVSLVGQNSSVHYNRVPPNYLRFTALEDNSTLQLKKWNETGWVELTPTVNIEYSYDGFNFTEYDYSELEFSEGETIYLRGNNPNGFTKYGTVYNDGEWTDNSWHYFVTPDGSFECHGNIMSLLYGVDFETSPNALIIPNNYCFQMLFSDSDNECGCSITTAPELPATTLTENCYRAMFWNCRSLAASPELPATTLAESCYMYMFQNAGLITASALPATTLAADCYALMFAGCTGLTTVPSILPATTLATECYSYMFSECESLTIVPELPATTLTTRCYEAMFMGCTSLTTAPELPATTLADYCYWGMFGGCTNLNSIRCLATNISATACTTDWVYNVAATGTFIKHPLSDWTTGTSGIPVGWTATDAFPMK